jgi:hypothetical protein
MNTIRTTQNVTGTTLTIPRPPEFEGRQVEVEVRVVVGKESWGEGLKRCAGALADDPEWDTIMDEIHQARKRERRVLAKDESEHRPTASTSGPRNPAGSPSDTSA